MSPQTGKGGARRPSRLSEGTNPRALDYELHYPGKRPESEILSGPRLAATLQLHLPGRTASDWHNRIYLGDNLGILRALYDEPEVRGRVGLVYIDPPFATGSTFTSRDAESAYDDHV